MNTNIRQIKQYLLYVIAEGNGHNWNIEQYELFDDILGRIMALNKQEKPYKVVIEYEDKTQEQIITF
jgi:hypothetical protein